MVVEITIFGNKRAIFPMKKYCGLFFSRIIDCDKPQEQFVRVRKGL